MSLPLVTGVAPRWESALAELVSASHRAHLVRRCADVAELVGVVTSGVAGVAVVSSDLRGLDRAVVEALLETGTPVLALHPPGDETSSRALRRWGVAVVLSAELTAADLDEALAGLTEDGGTDESGGRPGGRGRIGGGRLAEGGGHTGDSGAFPEGTQAATGHAGEAAGAGSADRRGPMPAAVDEETVDGSVDEELRRLVEEVRASDGVGGVDGSHGVEGGHGVDALHSDQGGPGEVGPGEGPEDEPPPPGELVAVWGAYGSPGRTTVAVNLAAELASPLEPVLLVDADTYGAAVAQALAVLDEAPGLAAATRAADQGVLDRERLGRLAPEVAPGLRVLTGLPRADRWPEVREASLADVLEQCRAMARWVVVDLAPLVEQDEELAFDTAAPRRNGAALTTLGAADRVVVVGSGDPLGLQRLVRALDALGELSHAPRHVVVTRVRPGPVGPEPGRRIQEVLRRFAGAGDVLLVPEDRDALDAALLHGRVLAEVRPTSPARLALQALADQLADRAAPRRGGRARGLRRWR